PGAEQEGAAPARSGAEPVQGGLSWRTRRGAAEHPRPAQPRCFEPVLKRGKAGCVAQHGSDISNREHKRLVYRGMTDLHGAVWRDPTLPNFCPAAVMVSGWVGYNNGRAHITA